MTNLMKRLTTVALFSALAISNVFAAQGRTDEITITNVKMYDPQNGDKTRTSGEVVGTVRSTKEAIWAKLIDFNNLKDWMPKTTYSELRGQDEQGRPLVYLKCNASAYGERDMLNVYNLVPENMSLSWEKIAGSWDYMRGRTAMEEVAPGVISLKVSIVAKSGLSIVDGFTTTRRMLIESTLKDFIINIRGQVGDVK